MGKPTVDYSLYLVTDSTPAILGDRDICEVVRAACKGGVTIVQYRDKKSDTGVLIETASRLHAITKEYNVPLLINDRVDVALAVGCEGVHIGQDDISYSAARRLLGPDAIVGVTASTLDEALRACEDGADYLGVGTVFATQTKKNTKHVIGTAGLREILDAMSTKGHGSTSTVCIGGINASNLQRVIFQSTAPSKKLDGVAIVSAIMAAEDPERESKKLLQLVRSPPSFRRAVEEAPAKVSDVKDILAQVPSIIKAVHDTTPLSHNMTNLVVQNIAANVALAVGASPIMANYGEEAPDLCKLGGALVINMGTVTPEGIENYLKALKAYNSVGQPVVFDPVGCGATTVRRAAVKTIMASGYLDIIKGNEGEIQNVFGAAGLAQQRGVDSGSTLDAAAKARLVRDLAARERNVVVMTGKTDYVSDGERTYAVGHGHEYLGQVSGTGCCLGTTVSAMAAARPADKLLAALAGLLLYEGAAEVAARNEAVRGPGTFVPNFIDELARCRKLAAAGDMSWLGEPRVERLL